MLLYSGDIVSLVYKSKKDSTTSMVANGKKSFYEFVFKSLLPSVGVRASKTCQEVDAKYEVYEVLGNGSYATVRRAIHRETRKEFAIKIVEKKQFSYNNPSRWQDQINEAKMLEKLNHENIVKLHEMILTEQALYMVLEVSSFRLMSYSQTLYSLCVEENCSTGFPKEVPTLKTKRAS